MATVNKYILAGSTLNVDQSGIAAVLVYRVSDLSGDSPNLPYLAYQESEIPKRGDPHPTIPNLQADTVSVNMDDANKALITVTFRQLSGFKLNINDTEPCQIEGGSAVAEFDTQLDLFGNQITLKHIAYDVAPSTASNPGALVPRTIGPQPGTVRQQVSCPFMRFSRRERLNPRRKSTEYTGAINSGRWLDGDSHTWMCRGINFVSDDGGKSYRVTYDFQYLADTWDPVVIAIDPATNEKVLSPIWGQGIKRVRLAPEKAFTNLLLGEA